MVVDVRAVAESDAPARIVSTSPAGMLSDMLERQPEIRVRRMLPAEVIMADVGAVE
jgi:hypothetical protein